jgi:hypothetical protein
LKLVFASFSDDRIREQPNASAVMTQGLLPGDFVNHPDRPDWGLGQVQSVAGDRVTVNFENAGKVTINVAVVTLLPAAKAPTPR